MAEQGESAEATAPTPEACAHCGAPLAGPFCAQCGQKDAGGILPISQLIGDALEEGLSLDGRLLRTLVDLVRPGRITAEYAAGHRVSYVSPVKLFLVATVVFFASLSVVGGTDIKVGQDADAENIKIHLGEEQAQEEDGLALDLPFIGPDMEHLLEVRATERLQAWKVDPNLIGESLADRLSGLMVLTLPLLALWMKLLWPRRLYALHLIFGLHALSYIFLAQSAVLLMRGGPGWSAPIASVLKASILLWPLLGARRVYGDRWRWLVPKLGLLAIGWGLILVAFLVFSLLLALLI